MNLRIVTYLLFLCLDLASHAAPTRSTQITVARQGRTTVYTVQMYGPLMVKADTSQAGTAPGTTALIGHVVLTLARPQGAFHLTSERAVVETQLMEVELNPYVELASHAQVLETFSAALKRFPSAPRIRTTWQYGAMGTSQTHCVLYNRQLKMLRSFTRYFQEEPIDQSFLYAHVSDAVLQRNYSRYAGYEGDFSTLLYCGATRIRAHSERATSARIAKGHHGIALRSLSSFGVPYLSHARHANPHH